MTVGVAIFLIFGFFVGVGIFLFGLWVAHDEDKKDRPSIQQVFGFGVAIGGLILAWNAVSAGFERL